MDQVLDILNRYTRQLAMAASVLLVVVISLSVANSVLFFLENRQPATAPATKQVQTANRGGGSTQIDIAALNLFGQVDAEPAPVEVVDAPVTRLNLELRGVFAAEDEKDSSAIIAEARKPGEIYRVGDRLPGNAILEAVFNDHVLLKRGNRLEKLMFPENDLSGISSASANENLPTAGPAASSRERLQEVRDRIVNRSRSSQSQSASASSDRNNLRATIDQYRQRLNNDPQGLLREFGVAPINEGESSGYRLGSDIPNQALQQAGLRPGDVILSVNGRPVGNITGDAAMIDQVMSSRRVRVEIQRESRRFFLTIPLPGSP